MGSVGVRSWSAHTRDGDVGFTKQRTQKAQREEKTQHTEPGESLNHVG